MGDSRCTLARGLIMFLDPENIGVTVGIMSLSAIISEMSISTSLCRPSWNSVWRPSQRHLVGPMGFLDA